jgi:hypothetical protein
MSERKTRLVHHIDKSLRVLAKEATNRVIRVVTRENGLDQGGKFVQSERAFNQTFTGWRRS